MLIKRTLLCVPIALLAAVAVAQDPFIPTPKSSEHQLAIDSGYVDNNTSTNAVVFTRTVRMDDATWLRLTFDKTNLPAGTKLHLTGLKKNWVQYLDGKSIVDYSYKSCFFEGDSIKVELVAGPNTLGNRVLITGATVGLDKIATHPETICGTADNRFRSYDKRQGRLSIGCTGWLCDKDVMLTAGHCFASTRAQILHFNTPLSSSTGVPAPAHPNDQYPTISSSARWLNSGVGQDWGICRIGPNSNTGRLPGDAQGSWYSIGWVPGSTTGQNANITGYGTSSIKTLNQVQKSHTGPLYSINSTTLRYRTDTTGGNSGSPIFHVNSGMAIGIHTHGGCSSSGTTSSNAGTRIDRSDLKAAIRSMTRSVFVADHRASSGYCNWIPFGTQKSSPSTRNQRYQMLIKGADLGNRSAVSIPDLAFASCGTGLRHFDTIQIRMAQKSTSTLSTTFNSNMQRNVRTVLYQRNYKWTNVANTWNRIGLEYTYPYNVAYGSNLVIEVIVTGCDFPSTPTQGFRRSSTVPRLFNYGWTSTPSTGTLDTAALNVEVLMTSPDVHTFGLGCVGSNRRRPTLTLSGTGAANSTLGIVLNGALPNANWFLSVGASLWDPPVDLGIVGAKACTMYFNNLITVAGRANSIGYEYLPVNIPTRTSYGQRAYFQWFPWDSRANGLGVTSSNYGRVLTGK